MMKIKTLFSLILVLLMLVGCSNTPGKDIDEEESSPSEAGENPAIINEYEIREGINEDVTAMLADIPEAYKFSSDFIPADMNRKLPYPKGNETVLNTAPDIKDFQALYLWEEGNAPTQTTFTESMTGYFDEYDFRPYVTAIPVREEVEVKGAALLMAGGAYSFRGNYTDTLPTAIQLRELGFWTFIVDYRLRPYTQQEGALDVARAVRYIRKNADVYGIDPNDIAVMGYSAGGIQAGEFLISANEDASPTKLDEKYIPDELDAVTAHVSADAMIYSFYGRLSVASKDAEALKAANLPPTFYCYGTEDPFYRQFEGQVELMKEIGIPTKTIVLDNWPHGFGGDGGWIEDYAVWLEEIFTNNG